MADEEKVKQLKAAKRSRGGHRAYATKLVKESEALLVDKSDAVAATKKTELMTNAALLEQKLSELRIWDEKITEFIDDDAEFEDEFVEAGNFNRTIMKVLVGIKEEYTVKIKPEIKPEVPVIKSDDDPARKLTRSAKLPRIKLHLRV